VLSVPVLVLILTTSTRSKSECASCLFLPSCRSHIQKACTFLTLVPSLARAIFVLFSSLASFFLGWSRDSSWVSPFLSPLDTVLVWLSAHLEKGKSKPLFLLAYQDWDFPFGLGLQKVVSLNLPVVCAKNLLRPPPTQATELKCRAGIIGNARLGATNILKPANGRTDIDWHAYR
jgi:hypothetical protein